MLRYVRYNTLDLDKDYHRFILTSCSKDFLNYVVNKITYYGKKWGCLAKIEWEDSCRKGYHVKLWCLKNCDLCRFVFDDFERYRRDINRRLLYQNVLFSSFRFEG